MRVATQVVAPGPDVEMNGSCRDYNLVSACGGKSPPAPLGTERMGTTE